MTIIKNYKGVFLVIFVCMIAAACKTDSAQKAKGTEELYPGNYADPDQVESDNQEKVGELYQFYTQNPSTQAEKDDNIIIDYIMKLNIPFERTPNGLYYNITQKGTGNGYLPNQPAKAHYRGYFLNGRIFDSSFSRDRPIDFKTGQMIAGWNEAMSFMGPGTKAMLIIPSRLAYKEKGFRDLIGPNEVIGYDIELLSLSGQ